ncbi:MAG: hypothetical protein HQK54_13290 [Oligoflexales bacterium]|nr:hypothetical protein [Oligoflexales bacterium]
MEGDPDLPEALYNKYWYLFVKNSSPIVRFGYFGSASTGVVSYADMNANENGYNFYQRLKSDPLHYQFRFSDYNINEMNETNVPSKFTHGVIAEK